MVKIIIGILILLSLVGDQDINSEYLYEEIEQISLMIAEEFHNVTERVELFSYFVKIEAFSLNCNMNDFKGIQLIHFLS